MYCGFTSDPYRDEVNYVLYLFRSFGGAFGCEVVFFAIAEQNVGPVRSFVCGVYVFSRR